MQRRQINHKPVLHIALMKTMPRRFDFLGLNEFYLRTQTMAVRKFHHLSGVGNTADQRALQRTVTEHDQRRKDLQLIRGHAQQTQLAASAQ